MARLIPYNRRKDELVNTGFGDFYNMLDDFFNDDWGTRRSLAHDTFKVDVKEDEKSYSIEAELPGVNKDEVDISLDDGRLQITVTREDKVEEDKKDYIHRERRYCSMQRSLYLADADGTQVKAKLENGELKIDVPKKEKVDTSIKIDVE